MAAAEVFSASAVRSLLRNPCQAWSRRAPTLLSLAEFRAQIPAVLAQRKESFHQAGSVQDPVMQLFRQLDTTLALHQAWIPYAHTDPSALYTRNLVDTDHETYSLLLLCWNPGKESPIHDHPGDGCWLQVLDGTIRECRYRHTVGNGRGKDTPLYCYEETTASQGDTMYIDDSQGLHKIGNPQQHQVAITLHLYSPPVQKCLTWKTELDRPQEAKMINYSEYGYKV